MGKLFLIICLTVCFVYGSQAQQFGHGPHALQQPSGENKAEGDLENELKDIRVALQRLNVTHEIPGICSVCKWVLRKTLSKLIPNETKEDLKRQMIECCGSYRFFRWICTKFVNGYLGNLFIDVVQRHMSNPKAICKALHLCWWPSAGGQLQIE